MLGEFYHNKSLFITGCTGFVGKVLLEKILFSVPQVKIIYVLIRTKKGSSAFERLQREIIDSPCFDRLRAIHTDFNTFVQEKIYPVAGDMLKDGLALDPADEAMLQSNVEVIMNCAASVDFNQRLDQAVMINTLGSMRILRLAKGCTRLQNMVQVSTAYVNCDKRGWVEEKVYPIGRDPDIVLNELTQIPVEQIEQVTPQVLGNYPNTYTFTKFLTEHLLIKHRGHVFLTILRPTIIGGSWKEPYPGWVDSVAAAGAFYLTTGIGLLKSALGNINNIGDQVPVDTVANAIIVSGALLANTNETVVLHVGTSDKNPVTWKTCKSAVTSYWRASPPENRISKIRFRMYKNPKAFEAARFIKRKLPFGIYLKYAQLTGNSATLQRAMRLQKLIQREEAIAISFSHFTSHEWIFENRVTFDLYRRLSKPEKEAFEMDVTKLNWKQYIRMYSYGLQRYVLNEQVEPPADISTTDLIFEQKGRRYFSDATWAYSVGESYQAKTRKEVKPLIIGSSRVQQTIQQIAENAAQSGRNYDEAFNETVKLAEKMTQKMVSDVKMPAVRMFAWFMRKVWRQIYEQVVIDAKSLKQISKLKTLNDGPILLAPSHRSYMDFLIVSYIFLSFNSRIPQIASGEDFLDIVLINHILRMSGAFFIRRKTGDDPLYSAILTEYVQLLLKDNRMIEFFVEGTRSRTGKTLHPKVGLLKICTDLYFDGGVSNLTIVPISISYDRVLEGETFPFELLGEEKVEESLTRIVKAVKILSMNFGKIHVSLSPNISLKTYAKQFEGADPFVNQSDRMMINNQLAYKIINDFQINMTITPTALVAAMLLMQRRGVQEDELILKVEWLRDEIKRKGYKIGGMSSGSANAAISASILHLNETVTHKKDLFEPSVSLDNDYKNILLLSYYKNTLMHIFTKEACCACALYSFGDKIAWEQGIPLSRAIEDIEFLSDVLRYEIVTQLDLTSREVIMTSIQYFKDRGVIELQDQKIRVKQQGDLHLTFLSSLLWPIIDTYWATILFCFALKIRTALSYETIIKNIQWFTENLYTERVINYYESCSQEIIKNAINYLRIKGVLEASQQGNITMITLSEPYTNNENGLQGMLDHLGKFRKASFVKVSNVQEDIIRAIISEFPTNPKL